MPQRGPSGLARRSRGRVCIEDPDLTKSQKFKVALAAVGIFTTVPGSQALAQMPSSDRERGTHVNASVPASEPDLLAAEFLRLNGFEASVAHFQDHIRAFGIENISDPRPAEVKAPEQRKATQRVIDAELPVLRRNAIRVVREIWTEQEMADINAFLKSSSGRSFL